MVALVEPGPLVVAPELAMGALATERCSKGTWEPDVPRALSQEPDQSHPFDPSPGSDLEDP